jgi:hypothetical protein
LPTPWLETHEELCRSVQETEDFIAQSTEDSPATSPVAVPMTPGELLSQTPNPDDIYYIRFNKVDVEGLYYPLSMIFEDMKKTMPGRKYEDLQILFKTAPPDGVQNLRYEFLRERNTVFWNTLVYPDSATTRNHENAEKWPSVYAWLIHDGRRGLGYGARIVLKHGRWTGQKGV